MNKSLIILLSAALLVNIVSTCSGMTGDAPNCATCNAADNTLCDVCDTNYKFDSAAGAPGNCVRCPGSLCEYCETPDFCSSYDDDSCDASMD